MTSSRLRLFALLVLVTTLACDGEPLPPLPPRATEVSCDPLDASGEPYALLSETGCFVDLTSLEPAPDLVPYDVFSPLWTDGADKTRYVVVPPAEQLTIREDDLSLPVGTLLIKIFSMHIARGERFLEARFSRQEADGRMRFFSYVFDGDEQEARRVERSQEIPFRTHEGEPITYTVPSERTCTTCHSGVQPLLGFTLAQIGRDNDYGPDRRPAQQLDAMRDIDLLEGDYEGALLTDPREVGPIAERARAWLHTHCSHCHRPGGFAPSAIGMDLRFDVPLTDTGLCDPVGFGRYTRFNRLEPGYPSESGIILRMEEEGVGRMPPVGLSIIDRDGVAVVRRYIESLPTCE